MKIKNFYLDTIYGLNFFSSIKKLLEADFTVNEIRSMNPHISEKDYKEHKEYIDLSVKEFNRNKGDKVWPLTH